MNNSHLHKFENISASGAFAPLAPQKTIEPFAPLEIKVSLFETYKKTNTLRNIFLTDWLSGHEIEQCQWLNKKVDAIREETAKGNKAKASELKSMLPIITPSGIFEKRKNDNLIHHSGLICLDFDNINPEALKSFLAVIPFIYYAGLSASGMGVFALIPISEPIHHREHFNALSAYFKAAGFEVDIHCKDIARARIYSYDNNPVWNTTPQIYTEKLSLNNAIVKPVERACDIQHLNKRISGIITNAQNAILTAPEGSKHQILRDKAIVLGGAVAGFASGQITASQAYDILLWAISQRNIESIFNAKKTIKDGLKYGLNKPIF